MNWADEPATETQLRHLRELGFDQNRTLTKREAAGLIKQHEEGTVHRQPEPRHGAPEAGSLRLAVENARRNALAETGNSGAVLQEELVRAMSRRQEFWLDTCREPAQMRAASNQGQDLYQKHGCRFFVPSREQVQQIFDALDAAMPVWDTVHPETFYQTLELNFPELVRRR